MAPATAAVPEILSNIVLSQIDEHAAFGGVVPEIAARAHVEALDGIVEAALREAGVALADIDAIAATAGPGLIGGLMVGLMTAKAIAAAAGKPLLAINHLEGHALTARLTDGLDFPYLLLLVSGGHTQIVLVRGVGRLSSAGRRRSTMRWARPSTRPRSCSACPIPADRMWRGRPQAGDAARFAFPRPMIGDGPARLFLLRPEDGGAPGRDGICAAQRPGRRRHLRLVPGGGRRDAGGPCRPRLARFRADFPDLHGPTPGGRRRRRRQPRGPALLEALCRAAGFAFLAPPARSAPTMPP